MRSTSLRCAILIAVLSLLASCGGGGGGGGSDTAVCTQTGNMTLYTSSTGTMLLTSVTVSAQQNAASVPPVPVFVGYTSPPVAAIVVGYPVGSADPRSFGIGIVAVGVPPANPLEFSITFNANRAAATYQATWRFVVTDAVPNVVGCQDLPVTFTVH